MIIVGSYIIAFRGVLHWSNIGQLLVKYLKFLNQNSQYWSNNHPIKFVIEALYI